MFIFWQKLQEIKKKKEPTYEPLYVDIEQLPIIQEKDSEEEKSTIVIIDLNEE